MYTKYIQMIFILLQTNLSKYLKSSFLFLTRSQASDCLSTRKRIGRSPRRRRRRNIRCSNGINPPDGGGLDTGTERSEGGSSGYVQGSGGGGGGLAGARNNSAAGNKCSLNI